MSEEEKKAYKFYKECNDNDLSAFEYFSEESKKQIKYMEKLLNLIEKQNKKIEQLEKNEVLRQRYKLKVKQMAEYRDKNYISKSAIREKINKLEDSLWQKGYEDEKSYTIKVLKKILKED